MRRTLRSVLAASFLVASLGSCAAGPHQLRRTIDDWDQKVYVNSPWLSAVLWIVPVLPVAHLLAFTADFLITDAAAFWLEDAWDGKGTGFEHLVVECTDGKMGSLLLDGAGWLRVAK